MKTKIFLSIVLLSLIVPMFASPILAQTTKSQIEIPNPIKTKSIAELIDRIVTYLITIATIIFPLVIIYGAFQLLSTGGDVEKAIMGRKTITYAVIGYVLILVSKGITMIVAEILGAR